MCGKGFEQIRYFVIWLILAIFLRSQSYEFDIIAHAGPPLCEMTVLNYMKIAWTVFEKFEILIERSGEKSTTAQVVENVFRLLKKSTSALLTTYFPSSTVHVN